MRRVQLGHPDINWLRAFTFTIYGTSVLVGSYFPLFYRYLGFSTTQIGYLYAIGPLISLFSNLLWSMISDRYRTIKRILLILLVGQLVLTLALSFSVSFASMMVVITIFYFFFYPIYPLADTLAISTALQYGRNFTVVRMFGSLGYAFFAIAIGYVLSHFGTPWTLIISMLLTITTLVFTFRIKDQPATAGKLNLSGLFTILQQKELIWFLSCVFCLAIGHRMNEAFLTITLKEMGAGDSLIGWSVLASSLSEIPIFFVLSLYGDRFKELPLLLISCIMFAARFLLMSITDSAGSVILIQMMHSVSFGIFYVTSVRYLARLIPDQYRATGLALFTIMWSSVSGLLSGALGGMVFEHFGRKNFYLVAMSFAILACAGFAFRYLRRPQADNQDVIL
ncbi:PPP family 3-phenylpropionic acid transporter [Paenibacillus shirakamiensis]|uniref:PPP family 3-phenylpropionic acid transporter n=1 Tax=Paenibacillus shirakamiensis TaxID=1265935 RepID=A0ABS4JHW0_9BACL|nr:MFS transporter [Paenibacillus shirakamiensis]MBP2001304.1 PPP family 3-phenylpropionic acid transporter [Paenibacillus shirakamiensis]